MGTDIPYNEIATDRDGRRGGKNEILSFFQLSIRISRDKITA